MPVYRDDKRGTWYCVFPFTDWTGKRKKKCKRGFRTKKEAIRYEAEFRRSATADMDMLISTFMEVYFKDKAGELKDRTAKNKRYMLEAHVLPYFADKKMNEITPSDIISWKNEIRSKDYSLAYLRMIQNQLTALFTHAQRIYGLQDNPCRKVKKMGRSDARKIDFWTEEEFLKAKEGIEEGSQYDVLLDVLFYTGCRIGEALALTPADFDFRRKRMSITKTFYRTGKQDVITSPKTKGSVRVIEIPVFLSEKVSGYLESKYEFPGGERIFPIGQEAVQHKLKYQCEKTGVKKIRVHDLRHSHVAFLINHGVDPMVIKERLGHEDIRMTLNTYGHLYPSKQREVADLLDSRHEKKGSETDEG